VGRYGGRRDRSALGGDTASGYVCEKIWVAVGLEEGAFVVVEGEVVDDWEGLVVAEEEDEGRRRLGSGRIGRVAISEAGSAYSAGGWWSRAWAWWWGATAAAGTAAAVEVMLSPISNQHSNRPRFPPRASSKWAGEKGETSVGRCCR
jgi:hypothetical protein